MIKRIGKGIVANRWLITLIVGIIAFWIFTPKVMQFHQSTLGPEPEKRSRVIGQKDMPETNISLEDYGTFGDSFGYINSLFSGFALVLVVVSVWLQSKELSDFRDSFKKDSFERTLFNIFNIFHEERERIGSSDAKGGKFFDDIINNLDRWKIHNFESRIGVDIFGSNKHLPSELKELHMIVGNTGDSFIKVADKMTLKLFVALFEYIHEKATYEDDLVRYVRSVNGVLRFIRKQLVVEETLEAYQKATLKYAEIFFKQLSVNEIAYLYLYGIVYSESEVGLWLKNTVSVAGSDLWDDATDIYPEVSKHIDSVKEDAWKDAYKDLKQREKSWGKKRDKRSMNGHESKPVG